MADAAEQARDFLRLALARTGLSPYKLAQKAGVAPTTITRPLNDPGFKFIPKKVTLDKIAAAAGLTAPQIESSNVTLELVSQWVPLVGEVRAGVWSEIPDEPLVEERIPVHLPDYERASLFAVRIAGRSMDLKYAEGTVVIALPAIEAGIRVGDDVVVRRTRNGLAETTLKEVAQDSEGVVLLPRSSDKSFEAIHVKRDRDGDHGVEIVGVVIYSISPSRSGRGPLIDFDQ